MIVTTPEVLSTDPELDALIMETFRPLVDLKRRYLALDSRAHNLCRGQQGMYNSDSAIAKLVNYGEALDVLRTRMFIDFLQKYDCFELLPECYNRVDYYLQYAINVEEVLLKKQPFHRVRPDLVCRPDPKWRTPLWIATQETDGDDDPCRFFAQSLEGLVEQIKQYEFECCQDMLPITYNYLEDEVPQQTLEYLETMAERDQEPLDEVTEEWRINSHEERQNILLFHARLESANPKDLLIQMLLGFPGLEYGNYWNFQVVELHP